MFMWGNYWLVETGLRTHVRGSRKGGGGLKTPGRVSLGKTAGFPHKPPARLDPPPLSGVLWVVISAFGNSVPSRKSMLIRICLAGMAGVTQALPAIHVIPTASILAVVAPMHDGAHMVRVGFALVGTDSPAPATRPRVTQEHGQPPRSVPLVAVAALVGVGSSLGLSWRA
jgi:hypothetical protein